jgi:hypothetical protein
MRRSRRSVPRQCLLDSVRNSNNRPRSGIYSSDRRRGKSVQIACRSEQPANASVRILAADGRRVNKPELAASISRLDQAQLSCVPVQGISGEPVQPAPCYQTALIKP